MNVRLQSGFIYSMYDYTGGSSDTSTWLFYVSRLICTVAFKDFSSKYRLLWKMQSSVITEQTISSNINCLFEFVERILSITSS